MIRRGIWGVALAAALVLAVGAGSASAAGLTIRAGKISGIVRAPGAGAAGVHRNTTPSFAAAGAASGTSPGGGTPPLLYGGGPLMHAVTTHIMAWAPPGHSFPGAYLSGYEQYLSDEAHDLGQSSNVSSVLAQYVDAGGSALQSLTNDTAVTDSSTYPASGCPLASGASVCLTDAQLESYLTNVIVSRGLSSDLSQSYVLLLPPGVDICIDASPSQCEDDYFCGYHSAFGLGSSVVVYTVLPYTESSYNGYPTCDQTGGPGTMGPDLTSLDSIGTHELLESATDPLGTGYLDSAQLEIGDECAWYYSPMRAANGGGAYNQILNGNEYLVQDMWSNQDNACVQGDSNIATATIRTSATPTAGSPAGLTVTLGGVSSSGAGYEWSYANQSGAISTDVASVADPQITFPSVGAYTVWVQVTDAAGGTVIGVADVNVDVPPTSAFTWGPGSPTAGSSVSFHQGAIAGTGSITSYAWSFGDGGSSSAADPSHTYTSAGTYTVTLTVTQSDGLTASTHQSITVTAAIIHVASASWLSKLLSLSSGQLLIPTLIKKGVTTTTVKSAVVSGRLVITWYATVKHRKVVVARGAKTVSAGVTAHISIRLTAAGRALLKRSRTVRVTVVGRYAFGTSSITSTRKLTLRR